MTRLHSTIVLFTTLLLTGSAFCAAQPKLSEQPARPSPEWVTRGVMYQIHLRAFTPEGTLRAATARLPEVANLGVTVVYLCPIALADEDTRPEFWSKRQKASGTNNPRNPYRMKDYSKIDPEYGTDADLRQFVETAHKLNMKVLLDLVYFHCGPTAVLVDKPDFVQRDAAGKFVTGNWNFPRLNFKNPALREYLWADMEYWVKNFNVDGYRCDVGDMVPLDFWEEGRERLTKLRPDVVMLNEGQRPTDQVKAFDLSYGFSWYDTTRSVLTQSQPASALRAMWEKQHAERPRGARFIRYTDNHDKANDMYRPDVVFSQRGAHAMSVINFTIDGMPFLYNGQEIGDTSLHSIFAKWPVRWEAACMPKQQTTLAFYKQLCAIRRSEKVLADGEVVWLENSQPDAIVSFIRGTPCDEIITVVNLSNRSVAAQIKLPGSSPMIAPFKPLLSQGAKQSSEMTFQLEGFGYFVAKRP